MKTRIVRTLLLAGVVAAVLLAAFSLVSVLGSTTSANNVYSLRAPSFVGVANAQGAGPQAIASFLDSEAGISAYFSTTGPIDLQAVKAAFRTIEVQTSDYIIGSVAVPDYPESEDVHVYVHKNGWFLAYYLKADPTGKIFDWRRYTTSAISTKLEKALSTVSVLIGITSFTPTFYDFRYPNASTLMLIAEDTNSGNEFQVNLPGTFTYYERSWSLASSMSSWACSPLARWMLDSMEIARQQQDGYATSQGGLTAAQLTANTFHTVTIPVQCGSAWGGLALTYRVP